MAKWAMSDRSLNDPLAAQREKIKTLANDAAKALEADIILLNGEIDGNIDYNLIDMVVSRKRKPSVYLILVTEGGSADAGFRIARCLQSCYRRYVGIVPGWCKSTGTLICMGASELQLGDLGELGPLDVQLAKPDELALIASGLTIDSSFRGLQSIAFQMFESFLLDLIRKSGGRITTKTAAELAANLTTGLMAPVFAQMDPLKIGEDYRSTRVAEEYALRLDALAQNLIFTSDTEGAIDTLVRGYPSHGFVIDRTEATTLFQRVTAITEPLLGLVAELGSDAVIPRSSLRSQSPIVEYLNGGEEAHDHSKDSAPKGDKPHSGSRATTRNKPNQALPTASTESDGKLPV